MRGVEGGGGSGEGGEAEVDSDVRGGEKSAIEGS